MQHTAFQLNKLRRAIRTQGKVFTVERPGKNAFGEPNGMTESQNLRGIYHETTSFLSKTTSEASTIAKRPCPMLLVLWEDLKDQVELGSTIAFNKLSYRVNAIKNLAEANLVADISLEEVQKPSGQRDPI